MVNQKGVTRVEIRQAMINSHTNPYQAIECAIFNEELLSGYERTSSTQIGCSVVVVNIAG